MTITIGELLDLSHLRLNSWAGCDAAARRTVTWAHASELSDPTPWLEGGELIMTSGFPLHTTPSGQVAYVEALAEHGIAGVAVSERADGPTLTPEMRATADRHSFPVLAVPVDVPFIVISRVVAAAMQDSLRRHLLAQVQVLDTIRLATQNHDGLPELLRRIEPRIGYDLYLVGSDGTRLLPDLPEPPDEVVARFWPREGPVPMRIAEGYVVEVPLSARSTVHLVAVRSPVASEHADLSTVQHAATLAALELERLYREREVLRRENAETFSELLSGSLAGQSAYRRLRLAGFDVDADFRIIAISGEDVSGGAVHACLSEEGTPNLLLVQQEILALVPDDAPMDRLLAVLPAGAHVGTSSRFSFGAHFATARHEALWALRQAAELGIAHLSFDSQPAGVGLLPTDSGLLRELVTRVLGPLLAYDEQRGTELVRSIRVWLQHDRKVSAAATSLHVHEHTLRYRLARAEEITGRTLSRSQDVAELWLACQAMEVGR